MLKMKFLALFALFVVALASDPEWDEDWKLFKTHFKKQYSGPEEEATRRANFEKNMVEVAHHNLRYDLRLTSFSEGVNEFADMTNEEFSKTHKGLLQPTTVRPSGK